MINIFSLKKLGHTSEVRLNPAPGKNFTGRRWITQTNVLSTRGAVQVSVRKTKISFNRVVVVRTKYGTGGRDYNCAVSLRRFPSSFGIEPAGTRKKRRAIFLKYNQ